VLSRAGVCAIPKSSSEARVREFAAVRDRPLDAALLKSLDAAFPPPTGKHPLEVI